MPLEKYISYLEQIMSHPLVRTQGTKLLLLTPPPVNQHQLDMSDWVKVDATRRTAENTKRYADACRELGNRLGVPVVDIWSAFMKAAGWAEGQPLAGSMDAPENKKLADLLSDGKSLILNLYTSGLAYETVPCVRSIELTVFHRVAF